MFPPICRTNFFHKFFSIWAVEKENKLLLGQKKSQFASWKRNIGNSRLVILSDEFVKSWEVDKFIPFLKWDFEICGWNQTLINEVEGQKTPKNYTV